MGADFAEMNSILSLLAHIDDNAQPLFVGRDQTGRDPCSDIAVINFAVPMSGKWILIGGSKSLNRLTFHSDTRMHTTILVVVVLDEIEQFVTVGSNDGDFQYQGGVGINLG